MQNMFRRVFRRGNDQAITLVSGLPRSGTSMMMQMLQAGGLDLLTDAIRQADDHNPNGYYEYERVKDLETGDHSWVDAAQGKGVKVIAALLPHLPENYVYRVIFMQRDLKEVIASQKRMLQQNGQPANQLSDAQLIALYDEHLAAVQETLNRRQEMHVLQVNYRAVIDAPAEQVARINQFLGGNLNTAAMMAVVNPALYRSRKSI